MTWREFELYCQGVQENRDYEERREAWSIACLLNAHVPENKPPIEIDQVLEPVIHPWQEGASDEEQRRKREAEQKIMALQEDFMSREARPTTDEERLELRMAKVRLNMAIAQEQELQEEGEEYWQSADGQAVIRYFEGESLTLEDDEED